MMLVARPPSGALRPQTAGTRWPRCGGWLLCFLLGSIAPKEGFLEELKGGGDLRWRRAFAIVRMALPRNLAELLRLQQRLQLRADGLYAYRLPWCSCTHVQEIPLGIVDDDRIGVLTPCLVMIHSTLQLVEEVQGLGPGLSVLWRDVHGPKALLGDTHRRQDATYEGFDIFLHDFPQLLHDALSLAWRASVVLLPRARLQG
mmetsp:Transcript_57248/g.123877  ORF Transcript_57248/g.123877 Transcript_57248/m.123877 type:complete len:201 (-) Transcript_57248:7-609(-)